MVTITQHPLFSGPDYDVGDPAPASVTPCCDGLELCMSYGPMAVIDLSHREQLTKKGFIWLTVSEGYSLSWKVWKQGAGG